MDFLNASRASGDIIGRANEFLIIAGLVYFTISFAASLLVKRLQKGSPYDFHQNINKWYGDFRVLTGLQHRGQKAKWSWSAARRAPANRL